MRRNLLSRIPVGVGAGQRQGGSWLWGLLGSQILAETATGTHGPGALFNDGLTAGLRYVPVLLTRSAPAFILFPNGSYEGPNPSSATYALYEQGTGRVLAGDPGTISISTTLPPGSYLPQPTTSASWSYKQTATLWPLTGRDEWTGAVTHGAPALFLCDYAEDDVRMRSASGEEFTSKLLIYTSLPGVKQGDMVKIGASGVADPFAAGAEEVRAVRTWADTFRAEGDPDFRIAT